MKNFLVVLVLFLIVVNAAPEILSPEDADKALELLSNRPQLFVVEVTDANFETITHKTSELTLIFYYSKVGMIFKIFK